MNTKIAPPHKIQMNIYILVISSTLFILFSLSELLLESFESINTQIIKLIDNTEYYQTTMIISFILNNQIVMFFLTIIVFNYFNIYKSFMLLTVLSLSHYWSSLLKLAYISPRPYFEHKDLTIYLCESGFGFPSTQVFSMVSFYLGLWRVLFESKTKQDKRPKYICLIIIILFITIITVTMILNMTHYCTQIITSYFLGVCLYILLFEVFQIDLNCGREFYYIIKIKLVYYIIIYSILASIPIGLYFLNIGDKFEHVMCNGKIHIPMIFDYNYKDNNQERYKEDSLILLGYFLGNIFSLIAIRLELLYLFDSNYTNWIYFNFNSDDSIINNDTSSLSCISITKGTKWNKTDKGISCLRLLVVVLIVIISFSPYFAISNDCENLYLKFFVKMFLPISLCVLCLFYFLKVILKKTELINTTLFTLIIY